MINLLKTPTKRVASPSAAPRESISAGHGLHRSISAPASPATLPPDRRGHLKNGNRTGDFLAAPRCGARTRCGGECRQPAMRNGRCRLHGGLSTGPRTPEGLARSRRARLTHGRYSAPVRALRTAARAHSRRVRALLALAGPSAGHGLHRSKMPFPVGARCARPPSSPTTPSSPASRLNDPRARAARPYTNQTTGDTAAGYGVHRSDLNRRGAETRRGRIISAPLRLCGELPFIGVSAGHGLHRPFFDTRPALR